MRHGSYDAKTCRAHAHAAAHKRPLASKHFTHCVVLWYISEGMLMVSMAG